MPDVTFEALVVAGLAILLWRPRPGFWRVAAGALVLALAADVRQIGELLIIPAVVFVVLLARGWRRRLGYLAVAVACFAVPVLGYMTVSSVTGHGFALTTNGGNVLYGRAAVAADCATLKLPADERSLCPSPSVAAWGIDRIINNADGPLHSHQATSAKTASQAASDFSFAVLKQQPLAIPLSVLRDATRLFALTRDGARTSRRSRAGSSSLVMPRTRPASPCRSSPARPGSMAVAPRWLCSRWPRSCGPISWTAGTRLARCSRS